MTRTASSSAVERRLPVPGGDLLVRASVACGRAEQLRAQTARSLGRLVLLRARLRRSLETVAEMQDRLRSAEVRTDNLERALITNRRIGMAVGILMRGLPASEAQAFDVLRTASMQANVKLRDVAERVIYTGAL